MSILITGAHGQLGSEIRRISDGYPYNFIFTDIDNLDIRDKHRVEELIINNDISVVINCAAYTSVDKAEEDINSASELNIDAVKNLVSAAKKNGAIFIHISTDYVFDGWKDGAYTEDDEENPQSVYGNTKLGGEIEARKYEHSVIIRTAWLYSIYGNNFVKTIKQLASERDTLNVVNDQYGSPTNAADLAKVILDNIEKMRLFEDTQIFNYTNEGYTTWYDFATFINDYYGYECNIVPVPTAAYPTAAKRPMNSKLDKSKIKETFNITIPNWKESLERVLEELLYS